MSIKLLPGIRHGFKIIQSALGMEVLDSMIFSVMRTDEELSIVCESSIKLNSEQAETDWSALKAASPLVRHPVIFLRCAMITLPEKNRLYMSAG